MKKVAVFVEGQAEQIFVRDLLFYLFDPAKFSFECLRLHAKQLEDVPYSYGSEDAEVYFRLSMFKEIPASYKPLEGEKKDYLQKVTAKSLDCAICIRKPIVT